MRYVDVFLTELLAPTGIPSLWREFSLRILGSALMITGFALIAKF